MTIFKLSKKTLRRKAVPTQKVAISPQTPILGVSWRAHEGTEIAHIFDCDEVDTPKTPAEIQPEFGNATNEYSHVLRRR